MAALEHSAVLVIVMSPTFDERHWFQKEFSSFSNAAELRGGIVLNDRSRMFNVMISAIASGRAP